jgi:hypothetical protein
VFSNAPISSPPPNPSPTSFSPPFIFFFYFPFKSISGDIQDQKCSCCNLAKQVEARGSTLRASTNQKSKEKSATEGSLFQRCFTNYEKSLEVAGGNTPVYQSLRRNPLTKSSLHGATSKCFVGSQQELPKASVAETRLVFLFLSLSSSGLDWLYLWDVSDGDSVTVKMPNRLKQGVSGSRGLKCGWEVLMKIS